MKNFALSLLVAASFAAPFAASAHNVYNVDGTQVVSVIADDQYSASIAAAASRNSQHLMHMAPGQSFTSSLGVTDTCFAWTPVWMGCTWTVAL
jgi:hypothetical protein